MLPQMIRGLSRAKRARARRVLSYLGLRIG